jgi:hypothetical protein
LRRSKEEAGFLLNLRLVLTGQDFRVGQYFLGGTYSTVMEEGVYCFAPAVFALTNLIDEGMSA